MDYSLSIGIDNYLHIQKTPYANNDAKAFNNVMKEVFKVPNPILLLDNQATYTNIKNEFNRIAQRLDEDDRFLFFYAGHGINLDESPFISAFDSSNIINEFNSTWLSIIDLITEINNSGCQRSVFFIDACQSTIRLGSRKILEDQFTLSEIEEMIKRNTYSCVFSSCSHKGVADINPERKHGIWTNYLIEALSGKAPEALKNGNLTSNSLQTYLNLKVRKYCKVNHECTIQETYAWGKEEGEFLIFNFSPNELVKYDSIPPNNLKQVEFGTIQITGITKLSGFEKGRHTVPKYYSQAVDSFINHISQEDIKEHIENVSASLRKILKLKLKDFKVSFDSNVGYFECPYFDYSYLCEINYDDLSTVVFTATLIPHDVDKLVDTDIDQCFPKWFDYLMFRLNNPINIRQLIYRIEELEDTINEEYEYDYDSESTFLKLTNKKFKRTIFINDSGIQIKFNSREKIIDMLDSLQEIANQMMIISPHYKILG